MRKADLSLPANEMAAFRFNRVQQLRPKEQFYHHPLSITVISKGYILPIDMFALI